MKTPREAPIPGSAEGASPLPGAGGARLTDPVQPPAPESTPPGRGSAPSTPPGAFAPGPRRFFGKRASSSKGEGWIWLTGGGLALSLMMVLGLLGIVGANGLATFWPAPVRQLVLRDGVQRLGVVVREEAYRPGPELLASLPAEAAAEVAAAGGHATRRLVRVGNFDMDGEDFRWIPSFETAAVSTPEDAWFIERREWGPWIGWLDELREAGSPVAQAGRVGEALPSLIEAASARRARLLTLEKAELGSVNRELERLRLELLRRERLRLPAEGLDRQKAELETRDAELRREAADLRAEDARFVAVLREAGGRVKTIPVSDIVRAFQPNALGLAGKLRVYLSRWAEFLSDEPREANTEGGVWPAIFGTLVMTVLMSLAVAPFGVIAALYLREYARQGLLVSIVRIAVNNLAGVPSIVFGVFGLGFFCNTLGGGIDQIFFQDRLPTPTFGTGGILWASLTLALLTVPVVIVATEEALSAVPRSLREASYACGASRWQTIRRVVLPRAAGGILTGLILAMARGAGEVAPLMITGVVKLAPDLPFDGQFPYVHLERSFMHLGFHIYDVGFQSRNAEAGKPMVFTTTLLLIGLVLVLNLTAISLRKRLRKRFASSKF